MNSCPVGEHHLGQLLISVTLVLLNSLWQHCFQSTVETFYLPIALGWYSVICVWFIPNWLHNDEASWLVMLSPWSLWSTDSTPYRQITSLTKIVARVALSVEWRGNGSVYLLKMSVTKVLVLSWPSHLRATSSPISIIHRISHHPSSFGLGNLRG